ncbi:hypothetical protein [Pseudoclavibacter sp. CFCC 14310]|uniref:hypothetical protein n=1 Tax=Pseudoclavibacter sp. CFCC 14310 TaxID=2615180 RepID=UPI00178835B2|nr:hypothetical protein [Pseudoclavibacter sp. CFCC 14310]
MCQQTRCKTCGKITWRGCGQHVDQVMRGVPKDQRCPGHEQEQQHTGWFAKIFR